MQYYPPVAMDQAVVGRVVLDCTVNPDTTTTCSVFSEAPDGWGFGAAAMDMSREFRLRPGRRDNVVRVPLRFTLPPFDPDAAEELPKGLPPELIAFYRSYPTLDLPAWERAPNPAALAAAFPETARGRYQFGRALLSCAVNPDRSLRCTLIDERPMDAGFGAAALSLAPQLRIAEFESDFIARHATTPFTLPILFGGETGPIGLYAGLDVLTGPSPPEALVQSVYPEPARAAGVSGEVVVMCMVREAADLACTVEHETPSSAGFGAAALSLFNPGPSIRAGNAGLVVGDQLRFRIPFRVGGRP